MQHASHNDFARYPHQLAHVAADPLLSLWIAEDTLAAFVAAEIEALDPYSARVAEAEAAWLHKAHAAPWPPEIDLTGL